VDGKFTDSHKAASILVRTLLEDGASRHIAYEFADGADAPEQRVSAYTPSRNSPCPCGSGPPLL
jgi:hypothetical protein